MLPTAVGKGHAAELADKMVAAEDQNGVVMRGFVQSVVGDALVGWAPALCTALQPESFSMSVYEGTVPISALHVPSPVHAPSRCAMVYVVPMLIKC